MDKSDEDKYWEWIYSRPLDFTPLVKLVIDSWLDGFFPSIKIVRRNESDTN